jgi:lincosamide nucleotidyltransferase A/C/D/E
VAEMTAGGVVEIVRLFERYSIEFHIDGSWAVDAVLGTQRRSHACLVIAIRYEDVPRVRALLNAIGFRELPREEPWECNFVLGDDRGREIDVHAYTLDPVAIPIYGMPYPAGSLTGQGTIDGHSVRCVSPEWLVKFRTGIEPDEHDYLDVKALCARFGLAVPEEYARFE